MRDETIEPESRQVGFAITRDEPFRADEDRRVVDRVRPPFEQPDHGVNLPASARLSETPDRRAGHRFRTTLQLVEVVEQVAGEGALGENDQARTLSRRFPEPLDDLVEIPPVRAELGGGLGDRHPHGSGRAVSTELRCHHEPPRQPRAPPAGEPARWPDRKGRAWSRRIAPEPERRGG